MPSPLPSHLTLSLRSIERCLGEEGFLWEGAGVRGRDILQALSDGAMLQPALSVTCVARDGCCAYAPQESGGGAKALTAAR